MLKWEESFESKKHGGHKVFIEENSLNKSFISILGSPIIFILVCTI